MPAADVGFHLNGPRRTAQPELASASPPPPPPQAPPVCSQVLCLQNAIGVLLWVDQHR